MARSKDQRPEQASFEFDALTEAPRVANLANVERRDTGVQEVMSAPVITLAERRRSRHLDVVRKLLAETGVFRAD